MAIPLQAVPDVPTKQLSGGFWHMSEIEGGIIPYGGEADEGGDLVREIAELGLDVLMQGGTSDETGSGARLALSGWNVTAVSHGYAAFPP